MINLIVIIVTLFALVFVLTWVLSPKFRKRIEQPKYRMLVSERRFTAARKRG